MTVTSLRASARMVCMSLGTGVASELQIQPWDPFYIESGPTLRILYTRTPLFVSEWSATINSTDSLGIYNFSRVVENVRAGGTVRFATGSSGGTPDVLKVYEIKIELIHDTGAVEEYRPGAITITGSAVGYVQTFGDPPQLADDWDGSGVDFLGNQVRSATAPLLPVVVVQPVLRQIHRRDGLGQASVGRLTPGCNSVTRVIGGQP